MRPGLRDSGLLGSRGLGCFLLAVMAPALMGQALDWPAPNWDRDVALKRAAEPGADLVYRDLLQTLRAHPETLATRFAGLKSADAHTWPEREAGMQRFLQHLQQQAGTRLPPDALALLKNWQPQTLVAHDESAALGTPLFPIAALAQGLGNRWHREDALALGAVALKQSAADWLLLWDANTHAISRDGLLDALRAAPTSTLRDLLQQATNRRELSPSLTRVAVTAALSLRHESAMESLLMNVNDAEARILLHEMAARTSRDQLHAVLAGLCAQASPSKAALGIALLTPKLTRHAATERLLLQLLDHPALGSSAALALMRDPSIEARQSMEGFATSVDSSLRAQRARVALAMHRQREITP